MLLIKNGHIKTMTDADLPRGSVLIGDDGKIIKIGARISAPAGCEVIDVWDPPAGPPPSAAG